MGYTYRSSSQRFSSDFSEDTLLEKDDYHLLAPPRATLCSRSRTFALHGILITIYSIICFVMIQQTNSRISAINSDLIESPARSAVRNVQTVFDIDGDAADEYFGNPPTPEIDQRWEYILKDTTFRFSRDQMTRWGRADEGVYLSDNSGYMGTLNVFHELHCLKRIYMYIHKDHYYDAMNLTESEQKVNMDHTMHCLESIRRGIQCHGDISPITYLFTPDFRIPTANWSSPHECKDWGSLVDWAKVNSFDPHVPGLVVHPTLGPAYEGEPDSASKLGAGQHMKHDPVAE